MHNICGVRMVLGTRTRIEKKPINEFLRNAIQGIDPEVDEWSRRIFGLSTTNIPNASKIILIEYPMAHRANEQVKTVLAHHEAVKVEIHQTDSEEQDNSNLHKFLRN